jgi:hypothetical protein
MTAMGSPDTFAVIYTKGWYETTFAAHRMNISLISWSDLRLRRFSTRWLAPWASVLPISGGSGRWLRE